MGDTKSFKSIIILNEIITNGRQFKTVFNNDDQILEGLFIDLLSKGYLYIKGDTYFVTKKGEESFSTFMKRYNEYLKVFDIYSFVDLEKGEFAFSSFFNFNTDEEWDSFKSNSRFDDVRVAVAKFKQIDSKEIIFMSFINEGRFDTKSVGWQVELLSDNIWNEIDEIDRTAITAEQLGSQDVILDIINQGTELMLDLLNKESELKPVYEDGSDEIYDHYEDEYIIYSSYYDPYYISPEWKIPLFIW